jgi:hypothetical protein
MNLLMFMAPIAVILLVPATIFMEDDVVAVTIELAKKDFNIIWYLLINSSLAYFVNLTNFLVTKHTSALTLQVCPVIPFYTESLSKQLFRSARELGHLLLLRILYSSCVPLSRTMTCQLPIDYGRLTV